MLCPGKLEVSSQSGLVTVFWLSWPLAGGPCSEGEIRFLFGIGDCEFIATAFLSKALLAAWKLNRSRISDVSSSQDLAEC